MVNTRVVNECIKKYFWMLTVVTLLSGRWENFTLGNMWHADMSQARTCQSNSFPSDPPIHSVSPFLFIIPTLFSGVQMVHQGLSQAAPLRQSRTVIKIDP